MKTHAWSLKTFSISSEIFLLIMTSSVNMSETEALLHGQTRTVYSGSLNPVAQEPSRSIAESEYLVRKSKEDFNQPGIPIFRAIFVVMNAAMGAGILNFPQAFAKAGGVQSGMIIQLVSSHCFFVVFSGPLSKL